MNLPRFDSPTRRLLCARYPHGQAPIDAARDLQQPRSTADIAVPNQLPLALRVDVDFEALEAVRATDLNGILHRRP